MRFLHRFKPSRKVILAFAITLAGLFALIEFYALSLPWLICMETSHEQSHSGLDFEIVETDCDGTVSVRVSKGSAEKSTIFTYVPLRDEVHYEFPYIAFYPDQKLIDISVGTIRWVNFKSDRWEDLKIDYHVAKMEQPGLGDVEMNR